jgi:hypothetical protein
VNTIISAKVPNVSERSTRAFWMRPMFCFRMHGSCFCTSVCTIAGVSWKSGTFHERSVIFLSIYERESHFCFDGSFTMDHSRQYLISYFQSLNAAFSFLPSISSIKCENYHDCADFNNRYFVSLPWVPLSFERRPKFSVFRVSFFQGSSTWFLNQIQYCNESKPAFAGNTLRRIIRPTSVHSCSIFPSIERHGL